MSLFVKIQTVSQTNLPLSAIFQAPTIEAIAKVLRAEISLPSWYSLVPIQTIDTNLKKNPPIFIIHWLNHRELYQQLGANRSIYGLHYGIADASDRVPTLPTIEDLAAHYIKEMRELQPQGPYYLLGHSWGGTIAYEMSRQLVLQGHEVGLLGLFDTNLDENNRQVLPLSQKLTNLRRIGLSGLAYRAKRKLEVKFYLLKAKHRSSDFTNADLFIEDPRIVVAIDNYIPKPYTGKVILFQPIEPWISITSSVETAEVALQKLVNGTVEVYPVPGDHHSILREPNVSTIAETIDTYIRAGIADRSLQN